MEKNVELLRQYKELLDQGILTQEEFDSKKREVLANMQQQDKTPERVTTAQINPGQETVQNSSVGSLEGTISTAKTLGVLAIVGACTITLGGLICGIVGLLKVKDLDVPAQLVAQKDSAKKLNVIGIALAAGFTILAFIIFGIAGCSESYY